MRLIYVIGCCLTLVILVTPSVALGWGKKDDKPEHPANIQVGLVRAKKPLPAPQANQQEKASKLQDGSAQPGSQMTPKVEVTGTTEIETAKKINDINKKTAKMFGEKIANLKEALKNKKKDSSSDSLSDITRNVVKVAKRRMKVKTALIIYSIINLILYIAQYAGGLITPPVGKAIYFLDLFAKQIIRKPLDDYYADYQNAHAEAIAKYIKAHPEQFKNPKVGRTVLIKTRKGEYKFPVLKREPGEKLNDQYLHVADINAFRLLGKSIRMNR